MAIALVAWLAFVTGSLPPVGHADDGVVAVRDIRIGPYGDSTRIVVDLNQPVDYTYRVLAGPPRLAIDLPEVAWQVSDRSLASASGLIERFRFGRFRPGVTRVVLDVARAFEVQKVFELPPNGPNGHRIVLHIAATAELVPTANRQGSTNGHDGANGTASTGTDTRAQNAGFVVARPVPRPSPPRTRVVVIDPGHGGKDPGAIGARGTLEKDVVLQMGLELRRQLLATGHYEVVMTRDSDRIVRLRDRLRIARESEGELFISLHADSLPGSPQVRGASVYTLSEKASNDEAARLAASENGADILAGIDLSNHEDIVTEILIDLAQRDANNKSFQVAETFAEELAQVTRMTKRRHAQAGFVVLKSPDMPSLLLELGYLSHPDDERALRDPDHISRLATAMAKSVDRYFR